MAQQWGADPSSGTAVLSHTEPIINAQSASIFCEGLGVWALLISVYLHNARDWELLAY